METNTTKNPDEMTKLLALIERDGPKVMDWFADKFHDLNGSEPDANGKVNKNIFMSLIANKIKSGDLAQCIFDLGEKNIHIMCLLMKQLVMGFNILDCNNPNNAENIALLQSLCLHGISPTIIGLLMFVIADIFATKSISLIEETKRKNSFIEFYGYSVPSKDAVEKSYEFCGSDKILGICSGLGTWEYLFRLSGLEVTATDVGSSGGYAVDFKKTRTPIEKINHMTAIKKYGLSHNVLFMSWPPLESSIAVEAVRAFPGSKVIYIGECYGGCTANKDFFSLLNKSFVLKETIRIPSWVGIYDKMYFYVRK